MTATLDEQISQAFSTWQDSDVEFGRVRVLYEAACTHAECTKGPAPVELREQLLGVQKKSAECFAELARLTERRASEMRE